MTRNLKELELEIQHYENPPSDHIDKVYRYCELRGISKATAKKFRLGYSLSGYFHHRITIPLLYKEKVRYITSRLLDGIGPTHLHQAGSTEFAINHDAVDASDHIFLVEGPFDCMTLDQQGIPCVGLLGAHRLSRKVIKDIYFKKIFIAFDSDPNETGQKASVKMAKKLAQFGIQSKIVSLPKLACKVDINDFFRRYPKSAFMQLVQQAKLYNVAQKKLSLPHRVNGEYDILEIASKYIEIKKYGTKFKAVCPFHGDTDPSLVFYPETHTCYCFGCGAFANSVSLIKKLEEKNGNHISMYQAEIKAKKMSGVN